MSTRSKRADRTSLSIRAAIGLTAAAATTISFNGWAKADEFGKNTNGSGLRHDGGDHTFCYRTDATDRIAQAAVDGMNNLDSQAVIADKGPFECSSAIDIQFGSTSDSNVRGYWQCESTFTSSGTKKCARGRLAFNSARIPTDGHWKWVSCHEIGHSVGLRHDYPYDCMDSNSYPEISGSQMQYDQHHIDHINNQN